MSPSGLTRDTIIDHTKTGKALTLENFKRPYKIAPSFFSKERPGAGIRWRVSCHSGSRLRRWQTSNQISNSQTHVVSSGEAFSSVLLNVHWASRPYQAHYDSRIQTRFYSTFLSFNTYGKIFEIRRNNPGAILDDIITLTSIFDIS